MQLLVLVLILGLLVSGVRAEQLTSVSVQFHWKHQFEYAGFYAALKKGYYRAAGLEVTLHSLTDGTLSPIERLRRGEVTFAVSNARGIAAALEDDRLVLLANYFKRPASIFVVQPDIRLPTDLDGRRIGITKDKRQASVLTALLRTFNVRRQYVIKEPDAMLTAFKRRELDAIPAYVSNEPIRLKAEGVPFAVLEPWVFGIEGMDDNLLTRRAYADRHPKVVRAFVEATRKGWEYALAHPEEIVDEILENYNEQGKSRQALMMEAYIVRHLMLPDVYPIGKVNALQLRRVAETLLGAGLVDSLAGLEDLVWSSGDGEGIVGQRLLRYCNDPGWVPIDYVAPDGTPKGIAVDYARLLFARFLPQYQLKHVPATSWKMALDHFKNGRCDLLIEAVKTPARQGLMLFTRPYLQFPFVIITREDSPPVDGLEALRGKRIARQQGSALIELLRERYPDIEIVPTKDTFSAFMAVANGKADATLALGPVAKYMLAQAGMGNLVINGVSGLNYPIRMAVSLKHPELVGALNQAIALMPPEEVARIKARYLLEAHTPWWQRWELWMGVGALLLLVLVGVNWHSHRRARSASWQAEHDPLTGALNRKGLTERIGHLIRLVDEGESSLCLLMFDLDHFKRINDTYGHVVGDEVLKKLVEVVRKHVRESDLLVRWGGEEFILVCPGIHPDMAVMLADKLRRKVEQVFAENDKLPPLTISIGVTCYRLGESVASLIGRADELLYAAKRAGRNKVQHDCATVNDAEKG